MASLAPGPGEYHWYCCFNLEYMTRKLCLKYFLRFICAILPLARHVRAQDSWPVPGRLGKSGESSAMHRTHESVSARPIGPVLELNQLLNHPEE